MTARKWMLGAIAAGLAVQALLSELPGPAMQLGAWFGRCAFGIG